MFKSNINAVHSERFRKKDKKKKAKEKEEEENRDHLVRAPRVLRLFLSNTGPEAQRS